MCYFKYFFKNAMWRIIQPVTITSGLFCFKGIPLLSDVVHCFSWYILSVSDLVALYQICPVNVEGQKDRSDNNINKRFFVLHKMFFHSLTLQTADALLSWCLWIAKQHAAKEDYCCFLISYSFSFGVTWEQIGLRLFLFLRVTVVCHVMLY